LNVHRVSDVRQIQIHTAELLIPDSSHFEAEIVIVKLKRYKSPGSDQIQAELIQAGGEILRSKIYKLINCIWSKEKLPDQWNEIIIVSVHKKGDKTECSDYRVMLMLSTSYTNLSSILHSMLSPYIDEIIGDHQSGFRRNRSTTDQIFRVPQLLGEKM
jgi:hypothetical protein